jgi:hypothetical protein
VANLIEEAINSDDRERAARITLDALGIETLDVATTASPSTGQRIAMRVPASLATGYRRRRYSWPQ